MTLSSRDRAEIRDIEALAAKGDRRALVDALRSDRWTVRRAAIAALADAGDAAVPILLEALRTRRDDERQVAAMVDTLSASRGDARVAVEALASDENPAVVCDAAAILGRRREAASVPLLARLTTHPDDNVAVAAIEALGRIGGDTATDTLIGLARSDSFFRVFPAIDVLGRTRDPRATEVLAELLDDPLYAPEAARALGRVGDERATPALLSLLGRASDATVRVVCVSLVEIYDRTVVRYGGSAERGRLDSPPSVVRRLLGALNAADDQEKEAIVRVLGLLRDEAGIPTLIDLLTRPHDRIAAIAERVLHDLGRANTGALLEALRHADSDGRALLLPLIGARSSDPQPLVACLSDPSPRVRALAADALARTGETAAVPQLFAMLRDPDARVAQACVGAIQALGGPDAERLAIESVADPDPNVRRAAVRVLAHFGSDNALSPLLGAIHDPDERVRELALGGLALIHHPAALTALREASVEPSARTRGAAVRALGQVEGSAELDEPLLRALEDPDPWVRYYACQALGRRQSEGAVDALFARLRDDAGQVRVGAIEALARLKSARAVEALIAAADGEDADVRRAALVGFGHSGLLAALPLVERALHDEDSATRVVAVSALGALPGDEPVRVLADATRDRVSSVASAAVAMLGLRSEPRAVDVLVGLLDDDALADRAMLALAEPVSGRVAAILESLPSAGAERASRLAAALVRMNRPEARVGLVEALSSASARVRRAIAGALAAVPDSEHKSAILRALDREPDADVRQLLKRALST